VDAPSESSGVISEEEPTVDAREVEEFFGDRPGNGLV
jgi:hypothetical protein